MSDTPARGTRIVVNLDQIDEIARKGIRRAAVFMGLGVNAAGMPNLTNYQLYKDTTIHLLPSSVQPEVLEDWKQQFQLWVVGGGFREVVDCLCKYLDEIYLAASIATSRKHDPVRQKKFERKGLDKKLSALRDELEITSPNAPLVESFYPIRNCLVHRLGRVGHKDLISGSPLTLRYRRMEFVHTTESGKIIRLPDLMDPNTPPFQIEEAGSLGMQYQEHSLEYSLGTIVTFTPKELTEILFFTNQFLYEFNRAVLDFATRVGAYTPPKTDPKDPQDIGAPPASE